MQPEWIDLDVRPLLAMGREPFALIMNHLDTLEPSQGLRLSAPFHPKPLLDLLENQGWVTESRALEGNGFEVFITHAPAADAGPDVALDLRDLAPPEPMVRILESLEKLGAGARLIARTPFFPESLFAILQERGYRWEVEREGGQVCRITIART